MNNVFVYLEIEGTTVADVSLELLTKGRKLANQLGCQLEAVAAGNNLAGIEKQVLPFGVDKLHVFDAPGLFPYTSLPHSSVLINLFKEEKPQICLMGATVIGRDLGPRVSSALTSGLTADCTSLEIGNHEDKKEGKVYENLLYQIRPAFGGNIVATIVNPEHRPQMATVREGVMKKEILDADYKGEVINHDVAKYVPETDYVVKVIDRHVEKAKHNLKGAPIVIAGGYGMGSKEGFDMLFELAKELHAEVGASRAAVDAGYADHDRQIGQTGVTVRPKLYIACGISGQIQHIAGMQESGIIISINNDENAPINTIADYVINGTVEEVIPKMIKYYKSHSKITIKVIMKGLILIFVLLSGISSAIAQEKLWLDKNYQWTDDSIQAVKYALVSKINKKCIKVEEYALEGQKKDVWHFSEYKSNPRKRIREGLHTSFYANGKDSLTEVYRDNRLEGQTMVYYPDGAIHLARSYSDGKLDGTLLQYYPDGKLRREEHYSENQCTGGKMFDEHGTEMEHQPYFMFPSFPGGIENLMKLVANVTKYPEDAWKQKAEGRVILRFVVDEEGKMTHPQILQSVRYDIDKEAIRAFEAIADVYRWSPGYQDGEAKRVKFTIPLYFRIPK